MARIIETEQGKRRIIKLSSDDIISIVQSYQRIVPRSSVTENIKSYLEDTLIYVPEDV